MNNEQMRDSVCTDGITDYGLRERQTTGAMDDGGDGCIDVWTYGRMDDEWRIADNGFTVLTFRVQEQHKVTWSEVK